MPLDWCVSAAFLKWRETKLLSCILIRYMVHDTHTNRLTRYGPEHSPTLGFRGLDLLARGIDTLWLNSEHIRLAEPFGLGWVWWVSFVKLWLG